MSLDLALDNGGYLCSNSIRVVIVKWLNSFQVGRVRLNGLPGSKE